MTAHDVLALAIEDTLGPALILDVGLRIVAWTPAAEEMVGPLRRGEFAAKVLCGEGDRRPIAEGLAEGRAVTAEIPRPTAEGSTQTIVVRASPLVRHGKPKGWLLVLDASGIDDGDPYAPVQHWGMWTRSPVMKKLFRDIRKVARRDVTVLVRGETGTGKELVARAIHEASPRANGPFRTINCAALPANLLESELFGHVRGAFTGAVRDVPGHVRMADGGTLFLDEVAELPLELQAKLLRVLQERTVIPVGGREQVPVDVRFLSATHQSLREAVRERRFREDLLYRLRVIPLFIPALRERDGDVTFLAQRFAASMNDEHRTITNLSSGAERLLETYDWPGNVRELRNAIEYAFTMGEGPILVEADLLPELLGGEADQTAINVPSDFESTDDEDEATRIRRAIERAGGHRARAAAMLGMSRSTLWRRIKELGIEAG